ncbi:MAG: sigma-70 family RNA polymerase sigma factor [Planctomycetota bacterium]
MTRKTAEEKKKRFAEKALPHMNAMYAVALRMTGNDKEAEDLVQDGLLRAFRFFDRFEEGTNLKAWLMKVMTNIFLNRLKKYSRRPVMVEFEVVSGTTWRTRLRARSTSCRPSIASRCSSPLSTGFPTARSPRRCIARWGR